MPYTIPNSASATYPGQAGPDSGDLTIITAASLGTGVVSGCAVTAHGATLGVDVAAGVASIAGRSVTVTVSSNLLVAAADVTNGRYDLVTVGTSGAPAITAGTAAANPVYPAIPASTVVLAAIYVQPNMASIAAGNITRKDVILSQSWVSNAIQFGATANTVQRSDGVMTAASGTLTSAAGTFVAGDVGKTIWVNNSGSQSLGSATALTHDGTTWTVSISLGGVVVGQTVVLAGFTPAGYNGTFTVATVTTDGVNMTGFTVTQALNSAVTVLDTVSVQYAQVGTDRKSVV